MSLAPPDRLTDQDRPPAPVQPVLQVQRKVAEGVGDDPGSARAERWFQHQVPTNRGGSRRSEPDALRLSQARVLQVFRVHPGQLSRNLGNTFTIFHTYLTYLWSLSLSWYRRGWHHSPALHPMVQGRSGPVFPPKSLQWPTVFPSRTSLWTRSLEAWQPGVLLGCWGPSPGFGRSGDVSLSLYTCSPQRP